MGSRHLRRWMHQERVPRLGTVEARLCQRAARAATTTASRRSGPGLTSASSRGEDGRTGRSRRAAAGGSRASPALWRRWTRSTPPAQLLLLPPRRPRAPRSGRRRAARAAARAVRSNRSSSISPHRFLHPLHHRAVQPNRRRLWRGAPRCDPPPAAPLRTAVVAPQKRERSGRFTTRVWGQTASSLYIAAYLPTYLPIGTDM
mmetsp:Transcript_166163/g.533362  ORF Transcript_166163/g.533362 Transcript_166163/m.533362 type:complete len:202 (+) Transcript_166163:814-1419(+)